VVGTVPNLPDRVRSRVVGRLPARDGRWHSLLTESVNATRTMLLHSARAEGLRVVMVTSAVEGEGKTSLACQLAASLARAKRRTLLIDGDLRNPAAHRLIGLPLEPGLSEVLRGEALPADVIRRTKARGLSLLSGGRCDAEALQALAQDALA